MTTLQSIGRPYYPTSASAANASQKNLAHYLDRAKNIALSFLPQYRGKPSDEILSNVNVHHHYYYGDDYVPYYFWRPNPIVYFDWSPWRYHHDQRKRKEESDVLTIIAGIIAAAAATFFIYKLVNDGEKAYTAQQEIRLAERIKTEALAVHAPGILSAKAAVVADVQKKIFTRIWEDSLISATLRLGALIGCVTVLYGACYSVSLCLSIGTVIALASITFDLMHQALSSAEEKNRKDSLTVLDTYYYPEQTVYRR